MFGGSLGLQRQVQVLRSVCVSLYGAFDVGWPSGFQRPYSLERGAQSTLDCYRGVLSIAAAYVVPIVSSWGFRSHLWHEDCEFTSAQISFTLPPLDAPHLSRFILRLTFPHSCNSLIKVTYRDDSHVLIGILFII